MRLFIGIPISDQIKEKIEPIYEQLKSLSMELSIVPLGKLHYTLKFLGDVNDKNEIINSLKEIVHQKFKVVVSSLGSFDSKEGPRVIWIGEKSGNINHIATIIIKKTSHISKNEFPHEAHLTIARVKSLKNIKELKKLIAEWSKVDFGVMEVDKFVLYESKLTKDGSVYSVVKEFPLKESS